MSSIVQPTESQLDTLVAPYLVRQQMGLGFALGYASPEFTPPGNLYFAGNVQNQFGGRLRLDGDTLFELASISKTFTATLYALLVRSISPSKTVGDYRRERPRGRPSSSRATTCAICRFASRNTERRSPWPNRLRSPKLRHSQR